MAGWPSEQRPLPSLHLKTLSCQLLSPLPSLPIPSSHSDLLSLLDLQPRASTSEAVNHLEDLIKAMGFLPTGNTPRHTNIPISLRDIHGPKTFLSLKPFLTPTSVCPLLYPKHPLPQHLQHLGICLVLSLYLFEPTAPSMLRQPPIRVLTRPDPAWLRRPDEMGHVQGDMAIDYF